MSYGALFSQYLYPYIIMLVQNDAHIKCKYLKCMFQILYRYAVVKLPTLKHAKSNTPNATDSFPM